MPGRPGAGIAMTVGGPPRVIPVPATSPAPGSNERESTLGSSARAARYYPAGVEFPNTVSLVHRMASQAAAHVPAATTGARQSSAPRVPTTARRVVSDPGTCLPCRT